MRAKPADQSVFPYIHSIGSAEAPFARPRAAHSAQSIHDHSHLVACAGASAFWKVWYASYGEAVAHLKEKGGYLLPYRKQFLIREIEYLEFLGLKQGDSDLERVGPNFAEPQDMAAWESLKRKLKPST